MATAETLPLIGLRLDRRALILGYRLGPDALLVLLDLAAHAVESEHGIVVTASYRDIARRVGLSKDTVGRRIELLRRAGVVVDQFGHSASRFEIRDYLLRLDVVGIELDVAGRQA
jgi:DNA-binding transcriptional ArsR family regulator